MPLEYTPYVLPFLVSFVLTVALAAVGARGTTPAARVFAWLMAALSVWTLCYVLELSSVTLAGKHFWLVAKYLGAAPAPVLWFVFALSATGHARRLTLPVRAALAGWAVLTLLVALTNPWHGLMWTDIRLVPGEPESQAGHGAFFWAYAAAIYLFTLASVALFFNFYRTTPPMFRRQGLLLAVGGFLPLAGRMTEDLLGLDLIPKVDEVIFFFLGSGVLFALALFRYNALSLVPIAHHLVVHNIGAGIVVLDPQERVVDLNPYARALFGLPDDEGIGAPLAAFAAPRESNAEMTLDREGTPTHLSVQRSPILDHRGALAGHALVLFDITARREAERQLERLARTDALTGVTNRRHFLELAEQEVERARRDLASVAILLLDVDFFKKVNDRHGHAAGDEVLRRVAAAVRARLRASDLFARYGGEEFVALLPGAAPVEARAVGELVRLAVQDLHVDHEGTVIPVTVSVGVATGTFPPSELERLIAAADEALYAAKAGGRNRVVLAGERPPTPAS